MRIERIEEKIKTPQTPRRRVFLFIFSRRPGVSALKTASPSVHIKSALRQFFFPFSHTGSFRAGRCWK
jgi:hypothetical protein